MPAGGVLITRPEPGAEATAERLRAMGFTPVLAPVMSIATRHARLPPPQRLDAVLVTSANALPALPAGHHGLVLLAVGDATAAQARQAGFSQVRSAGRDAAALADLAVAALPAGASVLLASGERQGKALAATLRDRGFVVARRSVYAAIPARTLPQPAAAALQAGDISAALFFSTETAQAFAALLRRALDPAVLAAVDALAIADGVAEALAPLPWRRIRVASRPNQDELLALLS